MDEIDRERIALKRQAVNQDLGITGHAEKTEAPILADADGRFAAQQFTGILQAAIGYALAPDNDFTCDEIAAGLDVGAGAIHDDLLRRGRRCFRIGQRWYGNAHQQQMKTRTHRLLQKATDHFAPRMSI